METVTVTPGGDRSRAYPVRIGWGLLKRSDAFADLPGKQAFIISDKKLAAPSKSLGLSLRKAGWVVRETSILVSESAKDYRKIFALYSKLIESKIDRDGVLFALGGGVIGDLSGFIAATYLRGIRWVGVPSTLLAQVDSSIGGKTGVNHPLGKNLIGAFHQPAMVICDTDLLRSLSARDRISGLAEMIKCGLTFDPVHYDFIVREHKKILNLEPETVSLAIAQSIRWKASVVEKDEYERSGLRRVLNFGHTVGHALESISNYKGFRHGEAILWGMRIENAISVVRGHLSESEQQKIEGFLSQLKIPDFPPTLTVKKLFAATLTDKKIKDGRVNYVLLSAVGKTVTDNLVSERDMSAALSLLGISRRLK